MTRSAGVALVLGAVLLAVFASALIIWQTDSLRWRAQVLLKKSTGDLDDISFVELVQMLRPGSGFWLKPVADGIGLHGAIANPFVSDRDIEKGAAAYQARCANCHDGHGGGAPDLVAGRLDRGASDWSIFKTIRDGIPQTAMQAAGLESTGIWQIVAYIRARRTESVDRAAAPDRSYRFEALTAERLRNSSSEPQNWLTYSGRYDGSRFSELDQIDRSSVSMLNVDWVLQLNTGEPFSESTPVIVDDLLFITVSPNTEMAVHAGTGRIVWLEETPLADSLTNCCGPYNRGVAVLGNKVFRGTLDGFLIARDAQTGKLAWKSEVGSSTAGFSITAAPLAVEDLIITGVGGGEYGIRGYLDAYDAETGERRWRTYTIPAEGEPGNETWEGESWKTGGGATWMTGSYDPELRLVYWGTGNPGPDFNGDNRKGDNLYTDSIIALEVDTGRIVWHFQLTPHDVHDWDANQVPVLADVQLDGVERKLLLTANKNGFGYVLDRVTGEFIAAHEVVEQNWAERIDQDGRPVKRSGIEPSKRGTLIRPAAVGGANWWPPSFNPLTGLVHYSLLESEHLFFKSETAYQEGALFEGGGGIRSPEKPFRPVVKAFHAGTSKLAWHYELPAAVHWRPVIGGTLTTAGMLVFFGARDYLFAVDAETGTELWRKNLGAPIHSAPSTYMHGGKQRVAITAGRSLYVLSLP